MRFSRSVLFSLTKRRTARTEEEEEQQPALPFDLLDMNQLAESLALNGVSTADLKWELVRRASNVSLAKHDDCGWAESMKRDQLEKYLQRNGAPCLRRQSDAG